MNSLPKLPIKDPTKLANRQSQRYFYEHAVKGLLPHIIDIMLQGIKINYAEVENLRNTIDDVLDDVTKRLNENPHIIKYREATFKIKKEEFVDEQLSKQRQYSYYLKPFKSSDMTHRSYYMETYIDHTLTDIIMPTNLGQLPNGAPKWSAKDVKDFTLNNAYLADDLQPLLDKAVPEDDIIAKEAMNKLAADKTSLYNAKYKSAIANVSPTKLVGDFNPGSTKQKSELFAMLHIECEAFSKDTGAASWNRDQVERVNKETQDEDVKNFTQAMIDHSFSAIIKNNFIAAFDRYCIDETLYGNLRLGGAKSFRLTSQNPNMLNMPSSRSIYAGPLKKCLTAPEGFIVATADFAALEDRVIASITHDETKVKIMNDGFDSHCVNAAGYFKEQVESILGPDDGTLEWNNKFKDGCATNKTLKKLRGDSKAPTFGLAYGAMAPKVASSLKISLPEAQKIYDRYHNVLYSGIAKYTRNYVKPTAAQESAIYLGLGLSLKTHNANSDIRTLHNATIQFWSVLTLLALARVNERIVEAGYTQDIQCVATIYDSIYYNCRRDPEIIKWLNETLTEEMGKEFMEGQLVQNHAEMEIGHNWASLIELSTTASIEDIEEVLSTMPFT